MNQQSLKRRKVKNSSKEELLMLSKEELVDRIIQLEAHNTQLKNIISKGLEHQPEEPAKKQKQFDFSNCSKRHIFLRILYFGWNYQGLAVQEDSNNTIEHHLFKALTKSCLVESRETCNYHRCGRTDKGVSSFGQVISITVRSKIPEEKQEVIGLSEELDYCKILNRLLPCDIRAICWMPINAGSTISARFDCNKRVYKYYFPKGDLDIESMRRSCTYIRGSHDFRNLCKMDVANGVTEFVRNVFDANIFAFDTKDMDSAYSMYWFQVDGNAFLWHQIRCIMAVLLLIGQRKEKPEIIKELLDVKKTPRKPQYGMALDVPLNLYECCYDINSGWYFDKEELKHIITRLQELWTLSSIKTTMIKDCLNSLESEHTGLMKDSESLTRSESDEVFLMSQAECLIQGVKSKIYLPLLERESCSSLEEKIHYYTRKGKIEDKMEVDHR